MEKADRLLLARGRTIEGLERKVKEMGSSGAGGVEGARSDLKRRVEEALGEGDAEVQEVDRKEKAPLPSFAKKAKVVEEDPAPEQADQSAAEPSPEAPALGDDETQPSHPDPTEKAETEGVAVEATEDPQNISSPEASAAHQDPPQATVPEPTADVAGTAEEGVNG